MRKSRKSLRVDPPHVAAGPSEKAATSSSEVQPARNLKEYARAMGPGLVVAFMWLGTGDLIDASVAGASYGYALIWGLALALICRYFYVSMVSKYVLCNAVGDDGILMGFSRLWRGFPIFLGTAGIALGFVYESYLIKAAGVALSHLTGQFAGQSITEFFWAAVMAAVSVFIVLARKQYAFLEITARISAVVLIVAFMSAAVIQGVDIPALVRGLSFGVPSDKGAFGAMFVVVAIIGAVGGSAANLLYPYFLAEKGWKGPAFRKMQRFDLLTGIASIVVINLAVWIVAAEAFGGTDRSIESPEDLASMMQVAVGAAGPTILWIGLFFVAFTSVPAYSAAFSKLFVDGVHKTFPARAIRYGSINDDPLYRPAMVMMLIPPLIFSMPWAPNVVVLTVIGSGFAVLSAPIIIVGVILLTRNKQLMLPGHANRWWETAVLVAIGAVGIWAIYHLIEGLGQLAT